MKRITETRKKYPKAYEYWIKQEEEELTKLFKEGMTLSEIANHLGRKPSAIRSRLVRLGLIK